MNGINSENIYTNLKITIEKLKEKITAKNILINKAESKTKKDQLKYLHLSNTFPSNCINWSFTKFSTYINNINTESPSISQGEEEENFIQNEPNQKSHIDITNKIFQLNQSINYSKLTNSIKAEIELEGESKFWVFLHCEEKNYNHKTGVIILSRENYNRNFISLGTFIEKGENNIKNNLNTINQDKNYDFIEFKKQELIEENSVKEKNEKLKKKINEKNININNISDMEYLYEKKSFMELNVVDDGNKVFCKIKLNEGEYINEIIGDFFFPVFENVLDIKDNNENEDNIINLNIKEKDSLSNNALHGYKIRIAGSGEKCTVISFNNELTLKNLKYELNKQTDCQCCEII